MPVYKLNNKRWYFSIHYQGQRYKRTTWNNEPMLTKAAAVEAERQLIEMLEKEHDKTGKHLTISGLLDEYVTNTKTNLKVTTLREYDKFKRLYLTKMQDLPIWDITPGDIAKWKNEMLKMQVSASYINRNLKIMKALLQYGTIIYNLPGNLQLALMDPIKDRTIRTESKQKNISVEQFEQMMSYLDTSDLNQLYYAAIFTTMFYTGIRIGELAALEYGDIVGNKIVINKDYARVNGVDYIQPPKSDHSVRIVLMDDTTSALVHEYMQRSNITSGIIFHKEGPYLNQQKLRRILKRLAAAIGINETHDIRPHILRHSHASYLRQLGYDEFTISARLGNTPEVAAGTYIHTNESEQLELTKKLRK